MRDSSRRVRDLQLSCRLGCSRSLPSLDLLLCAEAEFLLGHVGAGKEHERRIAPEKTNNALWHECFPVTALMREQ